MIVVYKLVWLLTVLGEKVGASMFQKCCLTTGSLVDAVEFEVE